MEEHDAAYAQHAENSMMLGPIAENGALLGNREVGWIRRRGLAAVVDGARIGAEVYLPAGIPGATAPIDVVAVHEQPLIEEAHFVERLPPNHGKTSDDDVHGEGAVMRKVKHVFAGEKRSALEKGFKVRG